MRCDELFPILTGTWPTRSIEVIPGRQWYLKGGTFSLKRVIRGWNEKLEKALARGFAGMRVTGNTAWLKRKDWAHFAEYEKTLNEAIAGKRMIVLCSYPVAMSAAAEVLDMARAHRFAIARRRGNLEVVEWKTPPTAPDHYGTLTTREREVLPLAAAGHTSLEIAQQLSIGVRTVETHRAHLELEIVLEPGLGITKADPSQLEQVLLNLAVNSRDAMPQGGRLAIVTSNFELDAVHERSHPGVAPGLYVVLTVSDTGHGMDAATRARIFEPFFTTKALDKGTGLGLVTVHGIVEQSGGTILVDSEVGQGTTFRIYLPRVSAPTRAPAGAAAAVTASRGTETIFLVEDDQQLRAITQEILEVMGYVVLAAPGPDQALALAAHQERINLLLTDIVMPTMNGFMLAERLKQAHPRMRVLCMSGYAGHVIAEQNVTGLSISLLQKPFTVEMLTAKVREVLDAPDSRRPPPGGAIPPEPAGDSAARRRRSSPGTPARYRALEANRTP